MPNSRTRRTRSAARHAASDLFLASHGRYIGPGGESVFRDQGKDWIAYHYYDADDNGTPKLGLNPLGWTPDGWPTLEQPSSTTRP